MTTQLLERYSTYKAQNQPLLEKPKLDPNYQDKKRVFNSLGLTTQLAILEQEKTDYYNKQLQTEKTVEAKTRLGFLKQEFEGAYFKSVEALVQLLYSQDFTSISFKNVGLFYTKPTIYWDKPEASSKPTTVVEYRGKLPNGTVKVGRIGEMCHLNTPIPYGAALLVKEVIDAKLFDSIFTIAPNEAWAKTYDVNKGEFEVKQFYPVIDPVIYGVVEENGKNHRFLLAKWGGE